MAAAASIDSTPSPIAIGTVIALNGSAQAKNPVTGEVRELAVGDMVYADEIIVTADGSAIAIEFQDGTRLDLGRNSEIALDMEVFNPAVLATAELPERDLDDDDREDAFESLISDSTGDIDAIQQALLAGEDPSELEATAAGPGTGGADEGGSSFVILERSGQQTTPDSGFNTDPIGPLFTPTDPEDPPVEDEEAPPEDFGVSLIIPDGGPVPESHLPSGSNPDGTGEIFFGSFSILAPDGVGLAVLNPEFIKDDALNTDDNVLETDDYRLEFTDYNPVTGEVKYTFTLKQGMQHVEDNPLFDPETGLITLVFPITVSDSDGDIGEANLTITVSDDEPVAKIDNLSVIEDIKLSDSVDNDDDTFADQPGSIVLNEGDGYELEGSAMAFGRWGVLNYVEDTGAPGRGSWEYTLYTEQENPQAYAEVQALGVNDAPLQESFNYTLTDSDFDPSPSVVNVTITGTNDGPVALPDTHTVQEDEVTMAQGNLIDGTFVDNSLSASGGADTDVDQNDDLDVSGVSSTNVPGNTASTEGGFLIISGEFGELSVNMETGEYKYTLTADVNYLNVDDTETDTFSYSVSDGNGGSDSSSLTITILGTNDGPIARTDMDMVKEDTYLSADGNVIDGFTTDRGTGQEDTDVDNSRAELKVVSVADSEANVGESLPGEFGDVVIHEDGSYTYTLRNQDSNVQMLNEGEMHTEQFKYTIADPAGLTSSAFLEIKVVGTDDGVSITRTDDGVPETGADAMVDEGDLPAGTHDPKTGLDSDDDFFTIDAPDGIDELTITADDTGGASITLSREDLMAFGTPGELDAADRTVWTSLGMLVITGYAGGAQGGDVSYTYTLLNNDDHPDGDGENVTVDRFLLALSDDDGNPADDANGTLDVRIIDDVPVLEYVQNAILGNSTGTITGRIALDYGADGPAAEGALTITGFTDLPGIDEVASDDGLSITGYLGGTETVLYTLTLDPASATYSFTSFEQGVQRIPLTFPTGSGGPGQELLTASAGDAFTVQFDGGIVVNGVLSQVDDPDAGDFVKPTGTGFGVGGLGGNEFIPGAQDGAGKNQNDIDDGEGFFVKFNRLGDGDDSTFNDTVNIFAFNIDRQGSAGFVDVHYTLHLEGGGTETGVIHVDLTNIPNNTSVPVEVESAIPFDEVEMYFNVYESHPDEEETPNLNFRVVDFEIGTILIPDDQPLEFTIQAEDGDGDKTQTENLSITMLGGDPDTVTYDIDQSEGSESEVIKGGTQADTIQAGGGDDTIIYDVQDTIDGGDGIDTLLVDGTMDGAGSVSNVEILDMTDGDSDDLIILSADDVLDLSDSGELRIMGDVGDDSDSVQLAGDWTAEDPDTETGLTTWINDADDTIMLHIQTGLNVTPADDS